MKTNKLPEPKKSGNFIIQKKYGMWSLRTRYFPLYDAEDTIQYFSTKEEAQKWVDDLNMRRYDEC